jgi:hypothetical protein
MDPRTSGGIVGSVLGILGGAIDTYCTIANTNGSRERAYMIKVAALCWLVVLTFLGFLFVTPSRFQVLLWLPYVLVLPFAIRMANQRHQEIRLEEAIAAGHRECEDTTSA